MILCLVRKGTRRGDDFRAHFRTDTCTGHLQSYDHRDFCSDTTGKNMHADNKPLMNDTIYVALQVVPQAETSPPTVEPTVAPTIAPTVAPTFEPTVATAQHTPLHAATSAPVTVEEGSSEQPAPTTESTVTSASEQTVAPTPEPTVVTPAPSTQVPSIVAGSTLSSNFLVCTLSLMDL